MALTPVGQVLVNIVRLVRTYQSHVSSGQRVEFTSVRIPINQNILSTLLSSVSYYDVHVPCVVCDQYQESAILCSFV